MKKFTVIDPIQWLAVLALAIGMLSSCSEEADPAPARAAKFTDANTDARYLISGAEFNLYLLGQADTLTFTNIIANPERTGTFEFDAVEGTPGKFKNASLYERGVQEQGLSAGTLEITRFSGDFIEFAYTVTFRTGRSLTGVYTGQIKPIK